MSRGGPSGCIFRDGEPAPYPAFSLAPQQQLAGEKKKADTGRGGGGGAALARRGGQCATRGTRETAAELYMLIIDKTMCVYGNT